MDDASSVESGASDYDEDDSGETSVASERQNKVEGNTETGATRVSGESSSASGGESDEKLSSNV